MTRSEYLACVRDLNHAIDEAEESGNESNRLGAVMALDTFLSVIRPPPDTQPAPAPKEKKS